MRTQADKMDNTDDRPVEVMLMDVKEDELVAEDVVLPENRPPQRENAPPGTGVTPTRSKKRKALEKLSPGQKMTALHQAKERKAAALKKFQKRCEVKRYPLRLLFNLQRGVKTRSGWKPKPKKKTSVKAS